MKYILMPSLQYMALVRIAVELWNQDDVRALLSKFFFRSLILSERQKEWQMVEDKVIDKIPQFSLPKSLKKEVLAFIKPIGLQILKWKEYHETFLSERKFVRKNLNKLYWTPQGTIDKKKTAEVLVKDESLDVTKRYKLACIYCLEDDIRALWKQMPEGKQKAFYNGGHPSFAKEHELVVFWTYDIKGELDKLNGLIKKIERQEMPPYQYAFECAAVGGNEAATKYFLQKLTPEEKERILIRTAGYVAKRRCDCVSNSIDLPKVFYTDILCFLLSEMDEEQQLEVFKSYSDYVLECLLDWPWQSCFMETAKRVWIFLSGKDYNYFLREMADKMIEGYKDYDYQKLFGKFWRQSSDHYKRYVIGECASGSLLSKLFKAEDRENIKLIIRDATASEKEKIISSDKGKSICESLIYNNKWDLLQFFINECISSKDVMIKFKEEFKERTTWCCSKEQFAKRKDMWDKFFQFLDDFIQDSSKKRSIEEDNHPAKKLCNIGFLGITYNKYI